jgi:hypothetical protein
MQAYIDTSDGELNCLPMPHYFASIFLSAQLEFGL